MKKKTFACAMGLVLMMSLAACGEEEVVVSNDDTEVTQEVQTQEAVAETQVETQAETQVETTAEAGTDEAEGGPLLQMDILEIPDMSGTEWNLAGGMIDGVEMEEEDLNASLEAYGGNLQFAFGDDGVVTMVQGGGQVEGTYEYVNENTALKMSFNVDGSDLVYAVFLTEVGDDLTLIAMPDAEGYNGLYFIQ